MVRMRGYNWHHAGRTFTYTIPDRVEKKVDEALTKAERVYTQAISQVLAEQPGDWTRKDEGWAKRSGDRRLFFGERGQFVASVTGGRNRRGLRAKGGDKRFFVGARHDIMHHSGYSMQNLARILQSKPDGSRILFDKAYERVEYQLDQIFRSVGLTFTIT